MHYKNGREAREGEPVITRSHTGGVIVGILCDTYPGSTTCNGMIARAVGSPISCTVGECFRADEALAAIEKWVPNPAYQTPETGPHNVA